MGVGQSSNPIPYPSSLGGRIPNRGGARDQLGIRDHDATMWWCIAVDAIQQSLDRASRHIRDGLLDSGERRAGMLSERHTVESDHSYIVGNTPTQAVDCMQRPECHQIVERKSLSWRIRLCQQRLSGQWSTRRHIVATLEQKLVEADTSISKRHPIPRNPLVAQLRVHQPCNTADSPMS